MGLLDFLSKPKANSTSVNPTVNNNPQAPVPMYNPAQPAGDSFSNISYPLPSTSIPSAYSAGTVQAQDFSNQLPTPNLNFNMPAPAQDNIPAQQPADIMNFTPPSQSTPQPVATPASVPILAAPKAAEETTSQNAYTIADPNGVKTTVYQDETMPQPQAETPKVEASQPLTNLNYTIPSPLNLEPTKQAMSESVVQTMPQPVVEMQQIQQPVMQEPPKAPEPLQNSDMMTAQSNFEVGIQPDVQTTPEPTIEIPASNPVLSSEQPAEQGAVDLSALQASIDNTIKVPEAANMISDPTITTIPEPVIEMPNEKPVQSEMSTPAASIMDQSPILNTQTEPETVEETPAQVEIPMDIPEQTPEPVVEVPSSAITVEDNKIEQNIADMIKFNVFKRIGFIGLNTDSVNSKVSQKLKDLMNSVYKSIDEFIIDSSKGYGKDVLKFSDDNKVKLTGVYLKPYYTAYSDETDTNLSGSLSYTTVMYSDFIERFKALAKDCDLFIIPETAGLNNFAQLFNLWTIDAMYSGQHKPVILLGRSWKDIMKNLKDNLKLSDSQVSLIYICENPDDAVNIIVKLDQEYSAKKQMPMKKVIDMREENDENAYFINS